MNILHSDTTPWPGGASARMARRIAIAAALVSSGIDQPSREPSGRTSSASCSVTMDRPERCPSRAIIAQSPQVGLDEHQSWDAAKVMTTFDVRQGTGAPS